MSGKSKTEILVKCQEHLRRIGSFAAWWERSINFSVPKRYYDE